MLVQIGLPLDFVPGEVHSTTIHIFMQTFKEASFYT
jgi:hypothetical protein